MVFTDAFLGIFLQPPCIPLYMENHFCTPHTCLAHHTYILTPPPPIPRPLKPCCTSSSCSPVSALLAHAQLLTMLKCFPLVQNWVKTIAKTGFGLANTGVSATIGKANKVLLRGETISLPPGLIGLPRNLSTLPANIRDAIPDIIARWAPPFFISFSPPS